MQELIYRGLEAGARVVAVCDVDSHRLENAQWLAEKIYAVETGRDAAKSVAAYRDFRELLARPDIDGVLIVTPDFWHAAHAVAAAEAGKDIYLEKPLTYTIAEGRKLVEAVREQQAHPPGRLPAAVLDLLPDGLRARPQRPASASCGRSASGCPRTRARGDPRPDARAAEPGLRRLDGPRRAEVPFADDRVHPQTSYERPGWLQIEPYCLGMITGWGSHMIDIAQWGHGTDDTGPGRASRPRANSPTAACSTSTRSSRPRPSTPTASG